MGKEKKLQLSVVTLLLLCIGLCITSFALSYTIIKVESNLFSTGEIKIDLNGGKPIISEEDNWYIGPGMMLEEDFTITNKGGWSVYYKLYFENVKGRLRDVLEISIYKKDEPDKPLLEGKIKDLVNADLLSIAGELKRGETQILTASFYFPEDADESCGGETLEFDMSAIAVQTKNNPNKKFK